MKIKALKSILCAAAAGVLLALASCVEDKGNYTYDYHDGIDFPYDQYSALSQIYGTAGLEVAFSPRLAILNQNTGESVPNVDGQGNIVAGGDNNAAGDFVYQWWDITPGKTAKLIHPAPTADAATPSSPESKFNYLIPAGSTTGAVPLELRATNTRSGAVFTHKYTLNITSVTQNGFLLLTQKGADVNLDMLGFYQNEFVHIPDILSSPAEVDRYPNSNRTALDVVAYRDQFEPDPALRRYSIWIITSVGCARVNPTDFSYKPTYDIANTVPASTLYLKGVDIKPDSMIVQSTAVANNMCAAFYFDGNWYWQSQAGSSTFKWENPVNIPSVTPPGEQDAYSKPKGREIPVTKHAALIRTAGGAMAQGGGGMLMWTQDNRFIYKTSSGAGNGSARGSMVSVNAADPVNETNPIFLWGGNYRMVEMGERNATNGAYAIVYDKDMEKYRFLGISGNATAPRKMFAYTFQTDKVSEENAKFRSVNGGIYMYIATEDDSVWSVYLDASMREKNITQVVNPDGHEIVAFRAFSSDGHTRANVLNAEWLYVVTKDPSLPDNSCCTLAVYRRVADDTEGNVELATYTHTAMVGGVEQQIVIPMKWSGLGNTVALEWKDI